MYSKYIISMVYCVPIALLLYWYGVYPYALNYIIYFIVIIISVWLQLHQTVIIMLLDIYF